MKDLITVSMSLYFLSAALFYMQGPWAREKAIKEKGAPQKEGVSIIGVSEKAKVKVVKSFTLQEIKKHDKITDCWMVIRDQVYDITPYISLHPTKPEVLTRHCGKESTQAYENKGKAKRPHSPHADQMLEKYRIGNLEN